jgi:hypothetical protein
MPDITAQKPIKMLENHYLLMKLLLRLFIVEKMHACLNENIMRLSPFLIIQDIKQSSFSKPTKGYIVHW